MENTQIKILLDQEKSLILYHYFSELTDALRPVLHNPAVINSPEFNSDFWFEKLFQLRSHINSIIEPDNLIAVQVDKYFIFKLNKAMVSILEEKDIQVDHE